jgi:hypothetical protein
MDIIAYIFFLYLQERLFMLVARQAAILWPWRQIRRFLNPLLSL